MRILHVVEPVTGGVPRHVVGLIRHVGATDHHVVLPAGASFLLEQLTAEGATAHEVHLPSRFRVLSAAALPSVVRVAKRIVPDVIHGHSSVGGVLARVTGGICRIPSVYSPHAIFPSRVTLAIERRLAGLSGRVVAMSNSEGSQLCSLQLATRDNLVVIPNGVEPEEPEAAVDLRSLLRIPRSELIVGSVGRLAPQKNPAVLVRAAAIGNWHLILVGHGPLREELSALASALGVSGRVHFLESFSSEGEQLVGQFDVFVVTSEYEAGAPFAALEAMRMSVPVIVSDVVGNRETVEHGVSGFVVPPRNPEALAALIDRLGADPELRLRLGRAGRERVMTRFVASAMGEATRALYEGLVRSSGPRRRCR